MNINVNALLVFYEPNIKLGKQKKNSRKVLLVVKELSVHNIVLDTMQLITWSFWRELLTQLLEFSD